MFRIALGSTSLLYNVYARSSFLGGRASGADHSPYIFMARYLINSAQG
jgi:hypothetical protein